MGRLVVRALGVLLLAGFAYLNVDYWRDPVYWRRWWDTMSHMQPDYLNLQPLEQVPGGERVPLPVATAAERTIADDALRAAEQYAAQFDSFALFVVHKGRVQTQWYRPGWQPDRLTQSQSMHKTVAALMLGAAIADGYVVSVDDPIGQYLTEWADDPRGRITIRNLLNMSSGLAHYDFRINPFASSSAFRFLFSTERERIALGTALEWAPGSKFDYNDVNAQLVGMIVQRASGRRYAEYLSQRLWAPIGAPTAQVWLDHAAGGAMTACCLLTPARAWVRLGMMLKDRGRVGDSQAYPADWIEQMITPSARNPGYGLFTWLGAGITAESLDSATEIHQSEPYAATDVFMLQGHGGQRVYVSRALDLVVVRLGPFNGYEPLKAGWDNARLFNIVARGIRE